MAAQELDRGFAPPPGPLGDGPAGRSLDKERLLALLSPQGALGRVLLTEPEIEAVVQGPDYTRVVLPPSPISRSCWCATVAAS